MPYNRAALILAVLEDAKVLDVPGQTGERRWLMSDCDRATAALREAL